MTSLPPLLPEQVLFRVTRWGRSNGLSVLLVAGIAAVLAAIQREIVPTFAALLAAGAGAMECHGAGLLRAGDRTGMQWLIRAELFLLLVVLTYCGIQLTHPDLAEMRAAFHATLELPRMREKWAEAQQLGITEDQYLQLVHRLTYSVLMVATVIYQGGMTIYYLRRRDAVARALAVE